MEQYSFFRALRGHLKGNPVYGEELKMLNAGRAEMRSAGITPQERSILLPAERRGIIASGTAGSGKEGISEDKLNFVSALRSNLVLVQAGAQFLTGLIGNVSIPLYSGTNATWKAETVHADEGAGTTSEVNLSPKRLTTYIDISTQFLAQDAAGFENMLLQDIVAAVAGKLEATILGREPGSPTQPAGIFYNAPSLGPVSWSAVVGMETESPLPDAKYITNSLIRGAMKTTPKAAGNPQYILTGKEQEVNGYGLLVTNNVPKDAGAGYDESGIAFGNWSMLKIGQWGAIEITVDDISQKVNGSVRLVVSGYFDAAILRAADFSIGTMK